MRKLLFSTATVAVVGLYAGAAVAWKEFQFWHAMGGFLGGVTNGLGDEFNKSQTEFKVVSVNKGF